MGLSSKKVLGIGITVSDKENILEEIRKYLIQPKNQNSKTKIQRSKPFVIFTPNPEIITYSQKDISFKEIVNSAQINIPDGAGVEWGIKKLFGMNVPKINGVDFMNDLCNLSVKEGLIVGLIGGRDGVAVAALECLKKKYPGLRGWAMDGPEVEIQNSKLKVKNYESKQTVETPLGWQAERSEAMTPQMVKELEDRYTLSLVNEIMERKTNILFIGLGCPKQEYFINYINQQLTINNYQLPIILMSVGGSFDYISGRIPRAPLQMRERGVEWLYRLVKEPWRIVRQVKGAEFFWRVLTLRHSDPPVGGEESR